MINDSSSPPLRRTASWQIAPDERLLEALRGAGWTHPRTLATTPGVWLTHRQGCERLRLLADGELVAPSDDDFDLYHITAQGREYLDGERDQELHPHPFYYGLATAPVLG